MCREERFRCAGRFVAGLDDAYDPALDVGARHGEDFDLDDRAGARGSRIDEVDAALQVRIQGVHVSGAWSYVQQAHHGLGRGLHHGGNAHFAPLHDSRCPVARAYWHTPGHGQAFAVVALEDESAVSADHLAGDGVVPGQPIHAVPVQRQVPRAEHAVHELPKRPRLAPAMGFQVADQLRQRCRSDRQQRFAYVVRREPDAGAPGSGLASPPCVWLQVDSRSRTGPSSRAFGGNRPSARGRGQGEPPGGGSLENATHSPGRRLAAATTGEPVGHDRRCPVTAR